MKAHDLWTLGLGAGVVAAILAVDGRRAPESAPAGDGRPVATSAVAEDSAGRHALRPYLGKPRPPVAVRLLQAPALAAGVPSSVAVEVTSRADVSEISLRLEGEGGLEVTRPARALAALRRGDRETLELAVIPTSGGPQRLAGRLEFTLDGQRMSAPVSLTLSATGPKMAIPFKSKPDREPVRDATGEWVYSLPAD